MENREEKSGKGNKKREKAKMFASFRPPNLRDRFNLVCLESKTLGHLLT